MSEPLLAAKTSGLAFSCQCGRVTGHIERAIATEGDHIVCHCTDCRDLVRHLGQDARVLDQFGGTALFQSRCARVRLETGLDQLACLHMTTAKTLRWYAACCSSPLFNTYANGRVPYVTTILANCNAADIRQLLGTPIGHLFTKEATSDASALPQLSMAGLMRRFLVRMIKDMVSGDRRRSMLFDPQTLAPIATPRYLTAAEQQALGREERAGG
jgi:hypothetical protein